MRKKRAKALKKLAKKEFESPDYKYLKESNPNLFKAIYRGIKKLFKNGKLGV